MQLYVFGTSSDFFSVLFWLSLIHFSVSLYFLTKQVILASSHFFFFLQEVLEEALVFFNEKWCSETKIQLTAGVLIASLYPTLPWTKAEYIFLLCLHIYQSHINTFILIYIYIYIYKTMSSYWYLWFQKKLQIWFSNPSFFYPYLLLSKSEKWLSLQFMYFSILLNT